MASIEEPSWPAEGARFRCGRGPAEPVTGRGRRALLLLALLPSLSFAQELTEDSIGKATLAVQNRKHLSTHELGVTVGVLPLDAFTKGLTLGAGYTIHFDETYAWEVVQGVYSLPIDTPLRADLEALDVRPTPFEVVQAFVTSSVVFKPIYWKGAWMNGSVLYGEMFLVAGGGAGMLTRSIRPAVDAGIGFRFYASENVSFRLDIRDVAFFTTTDVQNELWISFGLSL